MPSKNVTKAVNRLTVLYNRIAALPSLAPGQGYDDIGFELTDTVYANYSAAEKTQIIEALPRPVLKGLQRASIDSEMALEKHVIKNILAQPERYPVLDIKGKNPQQLYQARMKAFEDVTAAYPFRWSTCRARGEARLMAALDRKENHPGKEPGAPEKPKEADYLLFFGRSMMPLSGLNLHFVTGRPLVWHDPFSESAAAAQDFVHFLEERNILAPGAVQIYHSPDGPAKIEDADKARCFILDKDYDQTALIEMLAQAGVQNLYYSDVYGMAEILYPRFQQSWLTGKFKTAGMIVPSHCDQHDQPLSAGHDNSVVRLDYKKDEPVYVTTVACRSI